MLSPDQPNIDKSVEMNSANSKPPQENKRHFLATLMKTIKSHSEIIGICTAVIVPLSAGVSWAVAHFATQVQLSYLECRVLSNIHTQTYSMQTGMLAAEINWRNSQIAQLARQSRDRPRTSEGRRLTQQAEDNPNNIVIIQLSVEINELAKRQSAIADENKIKLEEMMSKCSSDAPTMVVSK
jgi:hypothetical protein